MKILKALGLACVNEEFRELLFQDPKGAAILYFSPVNQDEIDLLESMANGENAEMIKDGMKRVTDGICPVWPCIRKSEG